MVGMMHSGSCREVIKPASVTKKIAEAMQPKSHSVEQEDKEVKSGRG